MYINWMLRRSWGFKLQNSSSLQYSNLTVRTAARRSPSIVPQYSNHRLWSDISTHPHIYIHKSLQLRSQTNTTFHQDVHHNPPTSPLPFRLHNLNPRSPPSPNSNRLPNSPWRKAYKRRQWPLDPGPSTLPMRKEHLQHQLPLQHRLHPGRNAQIRRQKSSSLPHSSTSGSKSRYQG